jgi:hypothetical protein
VQKKLHAATVLSLAVPMLPRTLRADLSAWAFLIVADVHFYSNEEHPIFRTKHAPSQSFLLSGSLLTA